MRTFRRRAALVVVGVVAAVGLSSCGLFLVADSVGEDDREELFRFEMQPGTMNPAEAERMVSDQGVMGRVVAGSAVHRGSVAAPGGRVDFFSYRVIDPEMGEQPVFCTSTVTGSMTSTGCGEEGPRQPTESIQLDSASGGGSWRSVGFLVQDDVVRVEAMAADGTVYTVTSLNGFGYVEWPEERGSLELVAYNAADEELGRVLAGLDR